MYGIWLYRIGGKTAKFPVHRMNRKFLVGNFSTLLAGVMMSKPLILTNAVQSVHILCL